MDSVHGKSLARGNWNAPVCTDCHGVHTIAKTSDQIRGPRASCIRCHDGVRLTQEFGVPPSRVQSYEASYHGLARKMGSTVAADCASCHGAHDIRRPAMGKALKLRDLASADVQKQTDKDLVAWTTDGKERCPPTKASSAPTRSTRW